MSAMLTMENLVEQVATIGLAGAGVGVGIVFGFLFILQVDPQEANNLFKIVMLGSALMKLLVYRFNDGIFNFIFLKKIKINLILKI